MLLQAELAVASCRPPPLISGRAVAGRYRRACPCGRRLRNACAFTPIVAVAVLVAITVVLAAVLYVLVSGLTGPSSARPVSSQSVAEAAAIAVSAVAAVTIGIGLTYSRRTRTISKSGAERVVETRLSLVTADFLAFGAAAVAVILAIVAATTDVTIQSPIWYVITALVGGGAIAEVIKAGRRSRRTR